MTITPLDIYLVSLADNILSALKVVMFACLFALLFGANAWGNGNEDERSAAKKFIRRVVATAIASLFLYTAIPNSKTIAAMFVIPAIVNNEHIQNSAGNALGALEELTKQWLKDTIKDNASKQEEAHI